jgi:hypothetical protein
MKKQTKFKRNEAMTLAIALAVAGTLATLNTLLPVLNSVISLTSLLHASPYLLGAVGICLLFAEEQVPSVVSSPVARRKKEGQYGR